MVVASSSRLMVRSFVAIARVAIVSVVLVVIRLKDDLAECKMLVTTGSTRLMLNPIHHVCHAGTGKDQHQRHAQRGAKPSGKMGIQSSHQLQAYAAEIIRQG